MGPTMQGWPVFTGFVNWLSQIFGPAFAGTNGQALAICIFFLIPFTGIYVSLGGLWGVLWTDLFQFVLKMGIVIVVAYYGVIAAGGVGPMTGKNRSDARSERRLGSSGVFPGFLARIFQRSAVDIACDYFRGVSGNSVVGVLVSGRGARRRRVHRAANFQRAQRARGTVSPFCGSTSRTTRCVHGRGFSRRLPRLCCIRG